jgi:c-di-GMP-binding flagellar brake protein YcgR
MRPRRGAATRLHPRFAFAAQIATHQLSSPGKARTLRGVLRAKTENISAGGVCVRTNRSLKASGLVRCELRLPGTPVDVPFLAHVRWVEKRSRFHTYRVGLQFVV